MEKVTISKKEYENLKNIAESARALNDFFIPKINFGASFFDGKALEAFNNFSTEIKKETENGN